MKFSGYFFASNTTLLGILLISSSALANNIQYNPASAPNSPPQSTLKTAQHPSKSSTKTHTHSHSDKARSEYINVSGKHQNAGGGMMTRHKIAKTVTTYTAEYISQQSPMATVADLVEMAPGVTTGSDGTGTTSMQNYYMRGMNTSEIGILFEGMPASNAFNYSAYTPTIVDSQNMGSVSVMQGSVNTNAAVFNATGGQISVSLKHPSDKKRVTFSFSGGSYASHKEFVRLDSGEIGHSGVRAFVSASQQGADLWRAAGFSRRWHVDAAVSKQWNQHSSTEAIFGWNQSYQSSWTYPKMSDWKSQGTDYGLSNNPSNSNYYKYGGKNSNALYGTLKNHFDFGHGLSLDAQGYSILFTSPYTSSATIPTSGYSYTGNKVGGVKIPNSTFANAGMMKTSDGTSYMAQNVQPWSSQNSGINLTGTWHYKFNTLKIGYWYSYATMDNIDEYHPISGPGVISSDVLSYGGLRLMGKNFRMHQHLHQVSIDDKLSFFNDKLTIDGGLRIAMVERQATMDLPGANPRKARNTVFVPSPQVLITYKFNDHHQIYVNGTTGYHLPAGYAAQVTDYKIATGAATGTPMSDFKPEYMIGEEIGYRYTGPFMFNAAGFHYNLTNHQLTTQMFQPGSGGAADTASSQLINAGGMEAYGAQIELATRPWHHVSAYLSGSYLRTWTGNDLAGTATVNGKVYKDFFPTKGKQAVGAPQFVGALGLSYDDNTNFGRFQIHYTGKQYSTLMNDEAMPSYFVANIMVGRQLPKIWHISSKLTLNILNAGNNHYLSYIYSPTNAAYSTTGRHGYSLNGKSSPSYGIGQGFTAIAGLSGTFE